MNLIEFGLAGATLTIFISLLAVVSIMMDSAMQQTDNMISGMSAYSENPSDENMARFQEDIAASDNYLRDISYVSGEALISILDAIDINLLSDGEKDSLSNAKEFLSAREARDISDPNAIEINEKLGMILEKLDSIQN